MLQIALYLLLYYIDNKNKTTILIRDAYNYTKSNTLIFATLPKSLGRQRVFIALILDKVL